jgi:hypothetical protein
MYERLELVLTILQERTQLCGGNRHSHWSALLDNELRVVIVSEPVKRDG